MTGGPPPDWIFFDVDQTLCDFETMMRRALAGSITEIERRWPSLTGRYRPEDLEAIRDDRAAAYGDRPVPLVRVRREMFAVALGEVADAQAIDQITDHYLRIRFADPVLFADVIPTLEVLRHRIRLGVVTNGNSKLHALGLTQYFAAEFVAEQIGYAKPDRRIYDHAAAAVGADPATLLMVGDSFDKDVAAARAAGWRAVWLTRDAAAVGSDRINDLGQLAGLLNAG